MKRILTTIGVGRLVGVALTAGIVAGAVIAVPLLASADENNGDPDSTHDVNVIEHFLESSGMFGGLQAELTFEDSDDSGPSFRFGINGGPNGEVHFGADVLETTAELTGTEEADIAEALENGQTLVEYAEEHGVSEDALMEALLTGLDERLDEAVENGRLTEEEANGVRTEVSEHLSDLINGEMPFGSIEDHPLPPGDLSFGHIRGSDIEFGLNPLETVAELTGTEIQAVIDALEDGQTFAEFAEAHGVNEDELVDGLMSDVEENITEAVANGDLTQEKADEMLAELEEHARAMVNGEGFGFHQESGGDGAAPFGGIFLPGGCDDSDDGDTDNGETTSEEI